MLKYSQRFYKRQFFSRRGLSGKTVSKFNDALGAYFRNGALEQGLHTVNALAAQFNLLPRYLN
jgi:hypothetical protein